MNKLQFVILLSLSIYAGTFLLASSEAFRRPREAFGKLLDRLFGTERYVFETCRMCVGFWVTFASWLMLSLRFDESLLFFAAYGASYFLATQER